MNSEENVNVEGDQTPSTEGETPSTEEAVTEGEGAAAPSTEGDTTEGETPSTEEASTEAPATEGETSEETTDPAPEEEEGVNVSDVYGHVVRRYTKEVHGENYQDLAKQFADKHEGYVRG